MNDIKKRVVKAIDQWESEIVDFTKQLVSLETENPPGRDYKACVELIAEKLAQIGLESQLVEVPNLETSGDNSQIDVRLPRYCLLSYFGQGKRTLFFHGHYDVVPAYDKKQFAPYLKANRLYGRGTSDMKGGLAAMLYAVRAIKECNPEFVGRIGLSFVPDEETGGILGTRYLTDAGILNQNIVGMLMPEPTSGSIWNANRGAFTLKITIKGKYAHVGNQYSGINAFENMLMVAKAIQDIKNDVETRATGFNIEPDIARKSILMLGGLCHGGTGFNVVPDEIYFTIDRRTNPEENLEDEKKRLLDCLNALRSHGINVGVEILQEELSSFTPEESSLSRTLLTNINVFEHKPAEFKMCPGLLEIRFFNSKGIPALAYGPGLLECSHGPDEFIDIDNINRCAKIYATTALDLFSI